MTVENAVEEAALPLFYDASDVRNLPSGKDVTLYRDGDFAVNPTIARRFGRVRWFTVVGNYRDCGLIDWEPGNPAFTPAGLQRFVFGRRQLGKRARVYVDRVDARPAMFALGWDGRTPVTDLPASGHLVAYAEWHIATLDSDPRTRAELAAELANRWHAPIPEGKLWAQQYATDGRVDTSHLFGTW